jgi:maleamate amidohydrolase
MALMSRVWDDLLSEQDRQVIKKAGYDTQGAASWNSRGFGEHPAVLVIDMQTMQMGRNVPILEAIRDYRTAMGQVAWRALEQILSLLRLARSRAVPIIHIWVIPQGYNQDDPAIQIVEPLTPEPGEIVISKHFSSAFYGTPLVTQLIWLGVDTLILTGNSTSGCVRATAVDAQQHGFRVVLPEECLFDRIQASHKINLLDLWMKYAEVTSLEQVCAYLRSFDAAPEPHDIPSERNNRS